MALAKKKTNFDQLVDHLSWSNLIVPVQISTGNDQVNFHYSVIFDHSWLVFDQAFGVSFNHFWSFSVIYSYFLKCWVVFKWSFSVTSSEIFAFILDRFRPILITCLAYRDFVDCFWSIAIAFNHYNTTVIFSHFRSVWTARLALSITFNHCNMTIICSHFRTVVDRYIVFGQYRSHLTTITWQMIKVGSKMTGNDRLGWTWSSESKFRPKMIS